MPLEIDTDKEFDLEDLKHDIDESRKTDRWNDAPAEVKDIFHEIEWNVIEGEFDDTPELTHKALDLGVAARSLIAGPMATGIAEVGRRFKFDEYFLPEVMMSAKSMHAALNILKPIILAEKTEEAGVVVMGTIQGDLHDIGKNIVSMMMEAAGFTVHDLGVTTPPDDFIAAIKEHKPQILGMSALLTTTMNMQGVTIKAIIAEGLREGVKVLVGGAPVSQEWAERIGADGYAIDALVAVEKAKLLVGELKDYKGGDPELSKILRVVGEGAVRYRPGQDLIDKDQALKGAESA